MPKDRDKKDKDTRCLQALIDAKATPDIADAHGATPLVISARKADYSSGYALIYVGAKKEVLRQLGLTIFDLLFSKLRQVADLPKPDP